MLGLIVVDTGTSVVGSGVTVVTKCTVVSVGASDVGSGSVVISSVGSVVIACVVGPGGTVGQGWNSEQYKNGINSQSDTNLCKSTDVYYIIKYNNNDHLEGIMII